MTKTGKSINELWVDEMNAWHMQASALAKQFRVSHLQNLIKRADYVGKGSMALEQYIISSPIPPVLASTPQHNEAYMMVNTVARHRFSKEIAEELMQEKGEFAHFYALEKMESRNNVPLWRDVLAWLDEMKGESK